MNIKQSKNKMKCEYYNQSEDKKKAIIGTYFTNRYDAEIHARKMARQLKREFVLIQCDKMRGYIIVSKRQLR